MTSQGLGMPAAEVSDEGGIQDVTRRPPAPFLRTVALPVHEVLEAPTPPTHVQQPPHRVDLRALDDARRGGGAGGSGTRGQDMTGLTRETWKVGWILRERGRRRTTAARLMTRMMGKGPMNFGASLRDSTLRGRSRVDSHTFWPRR